MKKFQFALLGATLLFACDDDGDDETTDSGVMETDNPVQEGEAGGEVEAGGESGQGTSTESGGTGHSSGGEEGGTTGSGGEAGGEVGGEMGGDGSGGSDFKMGRINVEALEAGVTVQLDANIGTVYIPLLEPMGEVDEKKIPDAVRRNVSFLLKSNTTGVTVDLFFDGELVPRPLRQGQYSVALTPTRDRVEVKFYNLTNTGLTLKVGGSYTGVLAVAKNPYIDSVGNVVIPVSVQRNS